MGLRLPNLIECPPGMHRYFVHETKTWFKDYAAFGDLRHDVTRHLRANNLPIPLDLDAIIQDQECQSMPPGYCKRDDGLPAQGLAQPTLEVISRGTLTLVEWVATGAQRVSHDEATRRARVCMQCHLNQPVQGCTNCGLDKLRAIVARIVDRADEFPQLNACLVCGCALRAKVWLDLDLLQKREPEELQARYPDWCWLKTKDHKPV